MKVYVIRVKDKMGIESPIIFDPDTQLDENGEMTMEFNFLDKNVASILMGLYGLKEKEELEKRNLTLILKQIDIQEDDVVFIADEGYIHQRATTTEYKA